MLLEGVSLVLIEDDPIMGESLVQRLRLEGAHVTWWRSRAEASLGLAGTQADIAICDIRLPDGNGEDVFREAARRTDRPAFLFMTAYADIDQAVRLMKAGAGDYVAKPFEMQTLLARVLGLIGEPLLRSGQAPDLRLVRGEAEKALIERTIVETGGRIGEAARRLNVSRTTLWSRMKLLGIAGARRVQKAEHGDGRVSG
ncbi:response regulator transcription factor [Phreatobacter sp.]|uniref:response regulator transcription factor n=1 Tax=Phreatobacter sp. TaxID=1966341 RepID=UPI003F7044CB